MVLLMLHRHSILRPSLLPHLLQAVGRLRLPRRCGGGLCGAGAERRRPWSPAPNPAAGGGRTRRPDCSEGCPPRPGGLRPGAPPDGAPRFPDAGREGAAVWWVCGTLVGDLADSSTVPLRWRVFMLTISPCDSPHGTPQSLTPAWRTGPAGQRIGRAGRRPGGRAPGRCRAGPCRHGLGATAARVGRRRAPAGGAAPRPGLLPRAPRAQGRPAARIADPGPQRLGRHRLHGARRAGAAEQRHRRPGRAGGGGGGGGPGLAVSPGVGGAVLVAFAWRGPWVTPHDGE